jgi:hypothetical protein
MRRARRGVKPGGIVLALSAPMRFRACMVWLIFAGGCGGNAATQLVTPDGSQGITGAVPVDAALPWVGSADQSPPRDLGILPDPSDPPDLALPLAHDFAAGSDLGETPIPHATPAPIAGAGTLLAGENVLDVSTDQGGGVWAITSAHVYYFHGGYMYTYDQSNGLARGWATWTDTWYGYGTSPVTFTSVAGATSGQAVIGNIGAIGDRMEVNPSTGVVTRIDNMQVTIDNAGAADYSQQLIRVVASWRAVADLNGTLDGTGYLGGFHGFYAFHGLDADCGCQQFQQHLHGFADWAPDGIAGGDVRALAIDADGDVWQGDRDVVALWPQRSLGPNTDFFQSSTAVIDVFPNVRDEVWGLGVDRSGGVWVASNTNGLAYLAPATHAPTYYTSSGGPLPQNSLTDVTVDTAGDVWVATQSGGVARLTPPGTWSYYTTASGLASNQVNRLYVDRYSSKPTIYIATGNGVTVFSQ